MAKPVYYDQFGKYDDLPYGTNNPRERDIVYAGYTYEDWSGNALIVYEVNGELWENNDWHCSCNGLEHWSPEKGVADAIKKYGGWPGLPEAVSAWEKRVSRRKKTAA